MLLAGGDVGRSVRGTFCRSAGGAVNGDSGTVLRGVDSGVEIGCRQSTY